MPWWFWVVVFVVLVAGYVTATSNRLDTPEFTGTIGLPIPSTDIAIRDDDGSDCARGTPGEGTQQLYKEGMRAALGGQTGLTMRPGAVEDLIVEGGHVAGVISNTGWDVRRPFAAMSAV